eukprot:jgi/Chlat1/134/Chrsp1S03223
MVGPRTEAPAGGKLKSRAWKLVKRPKGEVDPDCLKLVEEEIDPNQIPDGDVLIRTVYLSLDPTNRIWMSDKDQYLPPVELNQTMRGLIWGVVEVSKAKGYEKGDFVSAVGEWADYTITDPKSGSVEKLPKDVPMLANLHALGMTGFTAYFGLLDIGQPKEGDTVVVSAAAGAVGSVVGQLAKIKGARAVGIVGSDAKCKFIKEELGFDEAINYKTEDLDEALKAKCPKGIDVYYENVGGVILEAVLKREPTRGPSNFEMLLMRRVRMEGFIVLDYYGTPKMEEARKQLAQWVKEGKLKYKVQLEEGLEDAPEALKKLFSGENIGKLAVKVSNPPKEEAEA